MENKKIKIMGGGLSGLSAAINLAKSGYDVEVFERNKNAGERFHGDMQGLENWSDKKDVMSSLQEMNIEINFEQTPFSQLYVTSGSEIESLSFDRPLFYLVKRGSIEGSIDQSFKKQAEKLGVKINFDETIPSEKADIIATGPDPEKAVAAAKGIIFKTDLENIAISVVNNDIAYQGYSYLLVANGYGCMCGVVFNKLDKLKECFERTQDYFTNIIDFNISNPKTVGGIGTFSPKCNFMRNGKAVVGEAAGIQDFLAEFGMRTAIKSGYLAARSIIQNENYQEVAEKEFEGYLKAGVLNRYLWEHTDFDNYLKIINKMSRIKDPLSLLRSAYNFELIKNVEYPIAFNDIKKKYKQSDID